MMLMCLSVRQCAANFRIIASLHSGMSSSSKVLRMEQPLLMKPTPSAHSWVQPERSRYRRRLQPLPVVRENKLLEENCVQCARLK